MATSGQRGKSAEGKVKEELAKLESQSFTSYRFPDARAGSFSATPCDYMLMSKGHLTLLEVKQVNHATRLPHGNFERDQCARMRNWKLAGASVWVLVHFTPLTAWRLIEVEHFLVRTGGSWVLSDWPLITLSEAIEQLI